MAGRRFALWWFQGLRRLTWHILHIWSPMIRQAFNLRIDLALLLVPRLPGSWNAMLERGDCVSPGDLPGRSPWAGVPPDPTWTFVDHLAPSQMIGLSCVGNDHPSNRPVSSFRCAAKGVKRLKQSLTRDPQTAAVLRPHLHESPRATFARSGRL